MIIVLTIRYIDCMREPLPNCYTRHWTTQRPPCPSTQVGFNSWYWLHCHSSLKVSSRAIENLRWQLSGEMIWVIFEKCVTSLFQQLKKKLVHKNCAAAYWLPLSLFTFFLKLLGQWCYRFFEGYPHNFSTELSSQIFDCCPRNFLIQEERIYYVVSTTNWITPVFNIWKSTCSCYLSSDNCYHYNDTKRS